MEHASRGHKENGSREGKNRRDIFTAQPDIAQQDRGKVYDQHVTDEDMDHGDLRQQAADQYIRPQESIVGKLITIAAASKLEPGWKQRVLLHTCIPYSFGKSGMLAEPIRMRTEHCSFRNRHGDQYKKKKNEG